VPQDYDVSSAMPCLFIHVNYAISLSLYPFTERYAQPYFFSCLIRQGSRCVFLTFPFVFRRFKTLCLLNYALMIRHDYDLTSSLRRGALQLWYQSQTRLAVYKFEGNALAWWKAYKQAKGGDAWLVTVTWTDFKKLFFLQFFPRAEQERLKREYHSMRQTSTETSKEFMRRFLRLAGSTLNHLMCMSYTDVAQVANAARNYEILHERDDEDTERPDKGQRSGDRHQPTSQQSSHRSHGHHNDRHGSDRRGGSDNHRSSNNNNSGSNNRSFGNGRDQRNRGQQSNRYANSGNSS
nr:hypothetical protein [Tanacetum cinerariifolium]